MTRPRVREQVGSTGGELPNERVRPVRPGWPMEAWVVRGIPAVSRAGLPEAAYICSLAPL